MEILKAIDALPGSSLGTYRRDDGSTGEYRIAESPIKDLARRLWMIFNRGRNDWPEGGCFDLPDSSKDDLFPGECDLVRELAKIAGGWVYRAGDELKFVPYEETRRTQSF